MGIYPQKQICFVYKWTQLSTSKWYIGSHTRKNAHPNNGYICSSKIVKPMIQGNLSDWVRIILETGSAEDMIQLEHELLTCLDARNSLYSYNGTNGGLTFGNIGSHSIEARAKMSKVKLGKPGKSLSIEARAKISKSKLGKPRSTETRIKIAQAIMGIKLPVMVCPHCAKVGGGGIMKRWHYDNCKFRYDYHRMH